MRSLRSANCIVLRAYPEDNKLAVGAELWSDPAGFPYIHAAPESVNDERWISIFGNECVGGPTAIVRDRFIAKRIPRIVRCIVEGDLRLRSGGYGRSRRERCEDGQRNERLRALR
jgi:hypothetical protein